MPSLSEENSLAWLKRVLDVTNGLPDVELLKVLGLVQYTPPPFSSPEECEEWLDKMENPTL